MTQTEKKIQSAQELVARVLSNNFGQKIDQETARVVAEKISKSVPAMREAELQKV